MPRIIFVSAAGEQKAVEAPTGESLMRVAVNHGVAAMVADCGGACCCGTCHVYVEGESTQRIPPAADAELNMLSFVAAERLPTSRLACQIYVDANCDGLIVIAPELQVTSV